MKFVFKDFYQLSLDELHDIFKLRIDVFVVEQNCPYPEIDDLDKNAIHLFLKEKDEIIAYARILRPGTRFSDYSIGRVVVAESARGKDIGKKLMKESIRFLSENLGVKRIKISAQKYLLKFYNDLGFRAVTEEYLEDGIPHIGMIRKINN